MMFAQGINLQFSQEENMTKSLVFQIEFINFIPNLYLEKIIFYYIVATYEVLKRSSVRNGFEIKSIAYKNVESKNIGNRDATSPSPSHSSRSEILSKTRKGF
jgi:hypothetical protein